MMNISNDLTTITKKTASFFYISVAKIKGNERDRVFVMARQFLISLIRDENTLEKIGKFLNNKDHCTIINNLRKHEDDLLNLRYNETYQRYLQFVGSPESEKSLSLEEIERQRDLKWIGVLEKYYGKNLNSTLLDNHIKPEISLKSQS